MQISERKIRSEPARNAPGAARRRPGHTGRTLSISLFLCKMQVYSFAEIRAPEAYLIPENVKRVYIRTPNTNSRHLELR